ncbi:hypothetical protein D3C83_242290 [compost metagenome]
MGQTPALSGVAEGAQWSQRGKIVEKADLADPRELDEPRAPIREALGEVLRVDVVSLQHLAGFEFHSAQ